MGRITSLFAGPSRALFLAFLAAGCQAGGNQSGDAGMPSEASGDEPFDIISTADTIHFVGTEPFWGGEATGTSLTYTTPENPDGSPVTVERFEGRGGLALSGKLDGAGFDMTINSGECSDGMSDRTYPFFVTLQVRGEIRQGCAWTDKYRFKGSPAN